MSIERVIVALRRLEHQHGPYVGTMSRGEILLMLAAESVTVERAPLWRRARLACFDGEWTVMVSRRYPESDQTRSIAHEAGHYYVHVLASGATDEMVRRYDSSQATAQEELEADLFADCLLAGAQFEERWAEEVELLRPKPQQPRVTIREIPTWRVQERGRRERQSSGAPGPRLRADQLVEPRLSYILRTRKWPASVTKAREYSDEMPRHEKPPFVRTRHDGAAIFTDRDWREWRVYDRYLKKERPVTVDAPSSYALKRIFIAELGERREYVFDRGELRELKECHLERQLDVSLQVGRATAAAGVGRERA